MTIIALEIVVKATVVLATIAVAQTILHRRLSAAMRHLGWTIATASLLLLPLLSLALPGWPIVPLQETHAIAAAPVVRDAEADSVMTLPSSTAASEGMPPAEAPMVSWTLLLVGVYAVGVFVMLVYWALQRSSVRRLSRKAGDLRDREWTTLLNDATDRLGMHRDMVRLLRSAEHSMPMTFGILRPTILIPAIADTWPDDRRRAVILHELAHVARRDCLTQSLAFAACILYWFHPLVWWMSRRLRVERELACDDRVIGAGAPPREYAGHLLEIAYSVGGQPLPALAVTMARPRQLEGRMLAALDSARNRRVPSLRLRACVAVAAAGCLVPLARATSSVRAESPTIAHSPVVPQSFENAAQQRVAPDGTQPGTWEIRATGTDDTVHLRLTELNSSSGTNVPLQRLEGLTAAQLSGSGGPVQFRLRRDAGTFTFEGVVRGGVGAGTFSFSADPNFPAELAKRGFARPTAREQYQMARHDVGFAFIDELTKQGYSRPQTADLVRAGQHGVDAVFVREMAALGHRLGSLDPLITLRDHDVTPQYVRQLSDQGYKGLAADVLRRARDHGITPDYIRAMRELGYRSLSMDQLITARDHGIDEPYAREMRPLGFQLAIEALVRARDHGVDVEYVRGMGTLGYTAQPIDTLIRLRDHGVTPDYVQGLKALGYDGLSVDNLVSLRDRGLTPDRVRAANGRARTRLPVDRLIDFADKGFQ